MPDGFGREASLSFAGLRRQQPIGGAGKRAFDVAIALAAVVFFSPLLLIVAALVVAEDRGPVFFRQRRVGFNGQEFLIWKFRTMTVLEEGFAVRQAVQGDRRVTRIGNVLRKLSIDELPQLFNVLAGEMSLIGPRPHAVTHDETFARVDPRYPLRRLARPGITGLAQVSGCRGPTDTDEAIRSRTEFDVAYVTCWSIFRDFGILGKTLVVMWDDPNAF
jgi:putative colanic acid biosynthesis UDP-glucose lipid carrier transferase